MRNIFGFGLALMVMFGAVAQASPLAEITCRGEGCLIDGWTVRDEVRWETTIVDCRERDCASHGWTQAPVGRLGEDIVCRPGGCFTDGYVARDRATGREIGRVSCFMGSEGPDCLSRGWSGYQVGGMSWQVQCLDSDCRGKGWRIYAGGQTQTVICKRNGCFQDGWLVYQP